MNNPLIEKDLYKYAFNEYLLVLKPNENLYEKILRVKEEFSEKYKILSAKHSYPHITLVNFLQFKMMENRLVNRLNTIAAGYHPFTISLKNYGSFPSHTIFVNIESKQQVQNLVKELKPAQQLMTLNKDNKPHFFNDPHLTIARKLLPWQYEQSWNEYSHRHFTGHFMAESMLLLKRSLAVGADGQNLTGKYQIARQFKFMNLPVATRQGELFV